MPVIEFLRYTETDATAESQPKRLLWIPNYHTGHLGFVPGTEISSSLRIEKQPRPGCELIATPFHRRIGSMFRLTVMLEDKRGVVNRLFVALYRLGLNVVKADSCFLNAFRHHFVELILDWARAEAFMEFRTSRSSDVHLYQSLRERVPMSDYRYLRLYEAIMAYCGDIIVLDRSYGGPPAPAIHVRPYSNRREEHPEHGTVLKGPRGGVLIELSAASHSKIVSHTGFRRDDPLPYVLTSQGESRTLRALFPTREQARRIFPVAMIHKDEVGALATFSHVLAKLGYNILASLLRKRTEEESTWEVLLETPEGIELPADIQADQRSDPRKRNAKAAAWFAEQLARNGRPFHVALETYGVAVAPPLYPRVLPPPKPWRIVAGRHAGAEQQGVPRRNIKQLLDDRLKDLDAKRGPRRNLRRKLITDVRSRVENKTPKIFLSYSRSATIHAAYLRNHEELKKYFAIVQYQEPDFAEIATKAIELIQKCDFFVGIWHAEPSVRGHGYQVSPWMPFEYGAALAAGKPAIVVHSSNLPKSITQRIKAGIAHPQFNDAEFGQKTVQEITKYCIDNWALKDDYVSDDLDPETPDHPAPTRPAARIPPSPTKGRAPSRPVRPAPTARARRTAAKEPRRTAKRRQRRKSVRS